MLSRHNFTPPFSYFKGTIKGNLHQMMPIITIDMNLTLSR